MHAPVERHPTNFQKRQSFDPWTTKDVLSPEDQNGGSKSWLNRKMANFQTEIESLIDKHGTRNEDTITGKFHVVEFRKTIPWGKGQEQIVSGWSVFGGGVRASELYFHGAEQRIHLDWDGVWLMQETNGTKMNGKSEKNIQKGRKLDKRTDVQTAGIVLDKLQKGLTT